MKRFIQIIQPDERIIRRFGDQTITVRRLDDYKRLEIKHQIMGEKPMADQRDQEMLEQRVLDAFLAYAIVEWSGIVDWQGREVACTPENKKALPTGIKKTLLQDAARVGADSDPEEVEKEQENLSDSPVSEQPTQS